MHLELTRISYKWNVYAKVKNSVIKCQICYIGQRYGLVGPPKLLNIGQSLES